jgi:ATP-binding cassette, subfamily B, bacterial PglK
MLKVYKRVFSCLTPEERRRSLWVLALMVTMAVFEVVGVASILPFLAVMSDPRLIEDQRALAWAYSQGGFASPEAFMVVLGLLSFGFLIAAAVVRSLTLYVQNRFIQMRRHALASRLLEGYLRQPYEFFLNRHTGDMGKNVLSEVDMFVNTALMPMGQIIASGLVLLLMVSLLLAIDPATALVVTVVLGVYYLVVYRIVRGILGRSGQARAVANRTRFESAAEALGGIKTLKVLGREQSYLSRFVIASETVARQLALTSVLSQVPKNAIEALAFGGIILGAIAVMWRQGLDGSLGTLLPMLSLYAFAGYRMLPALQAVYSASATLRFSTAAVETIERELETIGRGRDAPVALAPLPMTRSLKLRDVCYSYPGSDVGLHGVSLTVRKGESLGVVGRTGAGKTTLVDVILGLLVPQSGSILVDDVPLDASNRRTWQKSIGYVPQDIFLTDATVAENIALGLTGGEIDEARIEKAARVARIHDFVVESLPQGYATRVGERGVRLSGGQRQRIGIARALYHDPEVIVFDEATSALDSLTEAEVMEAIRSLAGVKTVILIAHRTGTLEACDRVVHLDNGRIFPNPSMSTEGEIAKKDTQVVESGKA